MPLSIKIVVAQLREKKGNHSFQTIFLMNENLKISSSFPQKAHKNSKEFGSKKMNK